MLPLFTDTATKLIKTCNGDAEKALCMTLAFISGHYKSAMMARSLITGSEKMLTVKLSSTTGGRLSVQNVYSIVKRYWPPQLGDNIRSMRGMRNGQGAVFDIYED